MILLVFHEHVITKEYWSYLNSMMLVVLALNATFLKISTKTENKNLRLFCIFTVFFDLLYCATVLAKILLFDQANMYTKR